MQNAKEIIAQKIMKTAQTSVLRRFLVGVARLELAASTSQMWRATNCATPRFQLSYYTLSAAACQFFRVPSFLFAAHWL